jgi:protocatechuate 3,4-dioxygenase beta subunit
LVQDLQTLTERRKALRWLAVGTSVPFSLWGCGGGSESTATTDTTTDTGTGSGTGTGTGTGTGSGSGTDTGTTTCSTIPSETAGPYPGDGTNTSGNAVANALLLSGIVRSDIRSSLTTSTTAAGVALTIRLKLVNTSASCASLAGYAVYLWHCDRDGNYSMYSTGITTENYLRGVQVTDAYGEVALATIFPGCYDGRYPHVHFEVYRSLSVATSGNNDVKTSQLTFTPAAMAEVYATTAYASSRTNYARTSLATDNVFSDDSGALQIATTTGSVSSGYTAVLQVGVPA